MSARPRLLSEHEIELCWRYEAVRQAAISSLGTAAELYLWTKNFSLGGIAPVQLLVDDRGVQVVLGELRAHAEGGPL